MDADTTGVDILDADTTGAEGGELECSRFSLSLSVQALSSTECTALARLSIPTDTGTTTIITLDTVPATPSGLANMIGCLISDMDCIPQPTGSGDDE